MDEAFLIANVMRPVKGQIERNFPAYKTREKTIDKQTVRFSVSLDNLNTDRQTNKQTDRQTDRQTERQRDIQIDGQTGKKRQTTIVLSFCYAVLKTRIAN